jgi:hypothetical protein
VIRLAGECLAAGGASTAWTERFAVTVTIDAEVLAGHRRGTGVLADGTPIAAATVRRSLPDARLEGLLLDAGRPMSLGRSVRLATRAQRRALLARDGGCAFPGCCRTKGLRAHHVVDWLRGGPTDVTNMVLLCQRHHTLLHKGEFDIRMVDGLPVVDSKAVREMRAFSVRGHPPDDPSTEAALDWPEPRPISSWFEDRPGDPPPPGAAARQGDPLTRYGLDVLISHLFAVRREARRTHAATAA